MIRYGIHDQWLSIGIPKQAQLYEFILKVLNNPINQHILSWKDKSKGIFYINDTKAFARLWGLHRNSDNMSYEKLSRAMRYYYRRNILEQIKGRRLYKFTAQMNKQIMDEWNIVSMLFCINSIFIYHSISYINSYTFLTSYNNNLITVFTVSCSCKLTCVPMYLAIVFIYCMIIMCNEINNKIQLKQN